jgi:purine-binding chemotaxis protein CheW
MAIAPVTGTSQYLSFVLDTELYALDITKVREVLEFTSVTPIPRTPDAMRGVINLRGTVVPVMDLRLEFGMPATEKRVNTCIIIVEVCVDGEQTVIGALADSVQEVMELETSQIDPPPRIGTRLDTTFITGMGKRDGRFIVLLDIERVFSVSGLRAATAGLGEAAAA